MKIFIVSLLIVIFAFSASRTTTAQPNAYTYQGFLKVNGAPANGIYEAQFALFDALTGGAPLTQIAGTILAINGVFTVNLPFGSQFTGANRFLEIRFRPSGSNDPFTVLAPRQQIFSAPYAIRSIEAANAAQLGGVAANQYVLTGDARLTDARTPLPGSTNYIQNTTAQQPTSNFNISGNGTAGGTLSGNIVNAATQFNLGGSRFMDGTGNATFVGFNAGAVSTGINNSFFGTSAGTNNTSGTNNSFFGFQAGTLNTTGAGNAFFGSVSGGENTTGTDNSFFGVNTGRGNTTGSRNSFFGRLAGRFVTTGDDNTFVGFNAGNDSFTGIGNTVLGANANIVEGANGAAAIGARALATVSNTMILGSINGVNGATVNTRVGIGTTVPTAKLTIAGSGAINTNGAARIDLFNQTFSGGFSQFVGDNGTWQLATTAGQTRMSITDTGTVGIGLASPNEIFKLAVDGSVIFTGKLQLNSLGSEGATQLCRNSGLELSTCSSSLRYKQNVRTFHPGLELVKQLRPVTFNWKSNNSADIGLVAEEVAAIEPLLTTTNDKGEIEGVKYDRVGVVLINAVGEQQAQIEEQKTEIESLKKDIVEQREANRRQAEKLGAQEERLKRQQAEIDALKQFVCAQNAALPLCRAKN